MNFWEFADKHIFLFGLVVVLLIFLLDDVLTNLIKRKK